MTKSMKSFFFFIFLIVGTQAKTQDINIQAQNLRLVEVLDELAEEHGFQYTASGKSVKQCRVSVNQRFDQMNQAVETLLAACDLTYTELDGVYVISPAPKKVRPSLRDFKGTVVDEETGDPIPYVVIATPNGCVLSDNKGLFKVSSFKSEIALEARHLAYASVDTVVNFSKNNVVKMSPREFCLDEVMILSKDQDQIFSMDHEISRAYREGRLNAGFYRTYEEFIENAPSIPWENRPEMEEKKTWTEWDRLPTLKLKLRGKARRAFGKTIGFCDGESIYFNLKGAYDNHFSRVSFAGPFASHPAMDLIFLPLGEGGLIPLNSYKVQVLNMEDGQYSTVDKRHMRNILKSDPELLQSFKKERRKDRKIQEYLLKFVQNQDL